MKDKWPSVVGFSYEADIWCYSCARLRFGERIDDDKNPPTDDEGNEVYPIFSITEMPTSYCARCHEMIECQREEAAYTVGYEYDGNDWCMDCARKRYGEGLDRLYLPIDEDGNRAQKISPLDIEDCPRSCVGCRKAIEALD